MNLSTADFENERILQNELWTFIQSDKNCLTQGKQHPYKLLKKEFLKNATTLRAISAFLALPIGKSKIGKKEVNIFRFGANPRVRAVISGNYDPYLEAATSSMFRFPVAKPVAAFGSLAGNLRAVPVHHIHGYVSHHILKETDYIPLQKDLVLTRNSYEKAWNEKDAFCATMIPQIFLLRHYITLFIGFSFSDPMITKIS